MLNIMLSVKHESAFGMHDPYYAAFIDPLKNALWKNQSIDSIQPDVPDYASPLVRKVIQLNFDNLLRVIEQDVGVNLSQMIIVDVKINKVDDCTLCIQLAYW